MKRLLVVVLSLNLLVGCTDNQAARKFGGTSTYNLPKGQKLVNVTWKGDSLWYLTRNMKEGEEAEEYSFHEKSSFGMVEGTFILKETK